MQSINVLLLAAVMVVCAVHMASAMPSSYNFGYGVNDPMNSDIKDQQETKDGDQVTGYYRLLDTDGLVRTVSYQAHPVNGFTAQVDRDPIGMEGQSALNRAAKELGGGRW